MKLTKKAQLRLERILNTLQRGEDYLLESHTVVCRTKSQATTTLDFTRKSDEQAIAPIEKAYGSDLCLIYTARQQLQRFIAEHSKD